MERNRITGISPGKLALGILIALFIGALSPFILTIQVSMMTPLVMIGCLMMIWLYCFAGPVPAGVLAAVQVFATAFFFDSTIGLIIILFSVIPGISMIMGIAGKWNFFLQMRRGLIVQCAGMFVSVVVAYLTFGGDMIARLIEAIRAEFARMPDELISAIVDSVNAAMVSMGAQEGTLTVEAYRELVSGAMLDYLQEGYTQTLPGSILCGAVMTAVPSVFLGNWMMARRGLASADSFAGMSQWHLPAQVTGALVFVWAASYLLYTFGYESGETVYRSVYMLVQQVFTIQALASFDRSFVRKGMRSGRRVFLLMLLWVASALMPGMGIAIMFYGSASALFGSRGAVTLKMKPRDNNDSDHNAD